MMEGQWGRKAKNWASGSGVDGVLMGEQSSCGDGKTRRRSTWDLRRGTFRSDSRPNKQQRGDPAAGPRVAVHPPRIFCRHYASTSSHSDIVPVYGFLSTRFCPLHGSAVAALDASQSSLHPCRPFSTHSPSARPGRVTSGRQGCLYHGGLGVAVSRLSHTEETFHVVPWFITLLNSQ